MAMSKMEMALLFGNIGAGALGSAVSANQQRKTQGQNELDLMVQRQLAALQNKQNTSADLQAQRQQGWKDQTSQSPLGQEQSFLQKQRLAQVLFPQIANFKPAMPTDPGVRGAYVPPTNILGAIGNPKFLETFGDQATATSLADRRKLMAGLNPDYEFSSLGNFGLDSSFDQGVNRAQQDAAGRRQAYESTQADLANQQYALASQQAQQAAAGGGQQKGGGVKGFLGGLLKTAAPFAAFIPGVGPAASIAMGAGAGLLGDKMQGNSWKHALGAGALTGAGTLGAEALTSKMGGQGLNPFNNNVGKQISAVPFGPAANPGLDKAFNTPNFAMSAPYNAAGDISAQLSAPQSSFRQLPPQAGGGRAPSGPMGPVQGPPQAPKGFNPQGYPLAAAGPYTGPGSTSTMIGRAPSGIPGLQPDDPRFRQAPADLPPSAQRAFEDIMNSGIGRGYSEGGWNIGGAGRGAVQGVIGPGPKALPPGVYEQGPVPPAPQVGAARGPAGLLGPGSSAPRALPSGQYNMGPAGSSSPAQGSPFNLPQFSPSNIENQQNAMNILNQLSKMPREQVAAFLASPKGRMILSSLPTAPKVGANLSPQQLMQMVVRGGG